MDIERGAVRWTQSSRRHRVGRHHARYVMGTAVPTASLSGREELMLTWVGPTRNGWLLEIIAVVQAEGPLLVIHVMPVYRGEGHSHE